MRSTDCMRKVIFRPYTKASGLPYFVLYLLNDDRYADGRYWIAYRFEQWQDGKRTVIAEGDDFGSSPLHSTDSDESVEALMGFLTLREHDTGRETFEGIVSTDAHREFSREHAEAVSGAVVSRFQCYQCGGTGDLAKVRDYFEGVNGRTAYTMKVCRSCRERRVRKG